MFANNTVKKLKLMSKP